MTGAVAMRSQATGWRSLADDLLRAIDWLDAHGASGEPAIRITVAADRRSLSLCACDAPGAPALTLALGVLPETTDAAREDGQRPPNAAIDRAVCFAAAAMLSWSKDPETFELLTHQRHALLLAWDEGPASPVDPWAYGLWDG